MEYLDLVFDQYEVSDPNYICVTRNADVSPDDEALEVTDDFRKLMQSTLHKRRRMAVVRLETAEKLTPEMQEYFCKKFKITPEQIFRTKMPMKLDYMFSIAGNLPESMKKALVYEPFSPQKSAHVQDGNMLKQVKKNDILLFYPYESMDPFLKLIKDAAADPNVMTIKITIYRLAKKARLVEYLCAAAENGKEVTVLIELRARFDEQNNIDWSERLEEAGCRVIYGFDGYKVHSKICLITYRNRNDIQYITQVGTGNYNEKTAAMYTDLSLMTADPRIGQDAAEFFKNMSIGNLQGSYQYLIVSPVSLKSRILQMMDEEIIKGSEGRIIMKMNSVTDVDFIKKVSEASCAGVRVDLIVRGICCILPGVPGFTENVRVMSVVGRYLEHPRIFSFGIGKEQKIYIGSADMMTRNTEKRVEVACPVLDGQIRRQINHDLKIMLSDNVKARIMQKDGTYMKRTGGIKAVDSQAAFMEEALKAALDFEGKPVFITDSGDNVTSGAGGWNTFVLKQVLNISNLSKSFLFATICDPNTYHLLENKEIGEQVHITLGVGYDELSSPVELDITIKSKGKLVGFMMHDHNEVFGETVNVTINNTKIDIMIASTSWAVCEKQQFIKAGIDRDAYDVIVVKEGYIFPELKAKGKLSIMSLTQGATLQDTAALPFKRIMRPMYPKDNI